jgi:hypothetical protein
LYTPVYTLRRERLPLVYMTLKCIQGDNPFGVKG